MPTLWAGIDAGKRTHHCVVIDRDGTVLLSIKVGNDETELLDLIATVIQIGDGEVCWATDLTDGGAALLIALLAAHGSISFTSPAGSCITPRRRPVTA